MAKIEGVVAVNMQSRFNEHERRIKFDGQHEWYGVADTLSDKLKRGSKVLVKVEKQGRNDVITKVKVLAEGTGGSGSGGGRRGGGGGNGMTKEEWAEKDRRVQYQHAQKQGIQLLALALETGAVKLPAKSKEEALLEYWDKYTTEIFNDIAELRAVGRVMTASEEDPEFDPEEEEDPEFED